MQTPIQAQLLAPAFGLATLLNPRRNKAVPSWIGRYMTCTTQLLILIFSCTLGIVVQSPSQRTHTAASDTAASLRRNNGKSKKATQKLVAEVDLYKQRARPLLGTMSDGGLDSLRGFWNGIQLQSCSQQYSSTVASSCCHHP